MKTALVIPDYAVRMAILDFEEFPAREEERISLSRFRSARPFLFILKRRGWPIRYRILGPVIWRF